MNKEWMNEASCRSNPDTMFATGKHGNGWVTTAKILCASCPVLAECERYAVEYLESNQPISHGIWAGQSVSDLIIKYKIVPMRSCAICKVRFNASRRKFGYVCESKECARKYRNAQKLRSAHGGG